MQTIFNRLLISGIAILVVVGLLCAPVCAKRAGADIETGPAKLPLPAIQSIKLEPDSLMTY